MGRDAEKKRGQYFSLTCPGEEIWRKMVAQLTWSAEKNEKVIILKEEE
jgi:hypothetical protein